MQDLTLVGLEGDHLVLVSDSGEEFALTVDTRLRTALRGEQPRLGQLEIQMDSALRPRDIQNRIRAGESPEQVALAAQTTVERIMGFATPVLAERAHIAGQAQRSSVRRKSGEGGARNLGDAVAERLRTRGIASDTVTWDAWRREDGRWTLVADYPSGESPHHAQFTYDVPGRYVVPENDEARWLIGEPQATRRGPQPRSDQPAVTRRRLTAVSDDELPLGDDAIELVSDSPVDELVDELVDEPADEPTVDLSDDAAAARARGTAERPSGPHTRTRTEANPDWIAVTDSGPATEQPEADPEPERPDEPVVEQEQVDEAPEEDEPPTPKPRRGGRKKRASVPSWDEIMFGGERRE